jgi:TetR/AcrR family transcriptional regulator
VSAVPEHSGGERTAPSARRVAGPEAKNRTVLLDAAEQLMLEEGHSAVTSRRLAARAGLKPQLVHYYFRTMDELFLAVLQRRGEEGLAVQARALAGPQPLRRLWEFSSDPTSVAITMEFTGLAVRRPAIRDEIARYAELFRQAQIEALPGILARYRDAAPDLTPGLLSVLLTSLGRVIIMERALGMSGGHAETLAYVEEQLQRLEGPEYAA